jgi:hypothetical protein
MPPKSFDPLWIISREEPHQSIMCKTWIKIKLMYRYMMHLDILKFTVENGSMKSIPCEGDVTYSIMGLYVL